MRDLAAKYRIELKYLLLTLLVLTAMAWIASYGLLDGVERDVNRTMDRLTDYGYPGLFLIALASNVTLVFVIPYALPLLTLATYAETIGKVVALGTSAGLGAGIGELTSYTVAHTLVRSVEDLEESPLVQWGQRVVREHPRLIPVLVWLASGTPVPDMIILVPLAMIRYPWRKLLIPMVTGKVFQNVVMALVYHWGAELVERMLARDANFDATASISVIFVMFILYQVEKSRAQARAAEANSADEG